MKAALSHSKNKIKRWDFAEMLDVARSLFTKINKRKQSAHHHHEIHFLAREINDWLPAGIQSMIDGSYTPRHLKRYYFVKDSIFSELITLGRNPRVTPKWHNP